MWNANDIYQPRQASTSAAAAPLDSHSPTYTQLDNAEMATFASKSSAAPHPQPPSTIYSTLPPTTKGLNLDYDSPIYAVNSQRFDSLSSTAQAAEFNLSYALRQPPPAYLNEINLRGNPGSNNPLYDPNKQDFWQSNAQYGKKIRAFTSLRATIPWITGFTCLRDIYRDGCL